MIKADCLLEQSAFIFTTIQKRHIITYPFDESNLIFLFINIKILRIDL